MLRFLLPACAVAVLLICTPASADRRPTAVERAMLAQAMEVPARCLTIRVATVRSGWASVRFGRVTPSCERYASDGVTVFRRRDGIWHDVFAGSSWACPIPRVPEAVRRNLRLPCPEGDGEHSG